MVDKDFIPSNWDINGSIIKVIGVGGGGNNAVNYMFRMGIEGVHFVVCNTDAQALYASPISTKVQLGGGMTRGRGAGCDPEQGKQAAIESLDALKALLDDGTEMIFITAGMGGGTGTGAAPIIAKLANEMGLLTVAIVTLPFRDEGSDFMSRARAGITELERYVDSLLVIDNERLYEIYGDLPVFEAFTKVDDVLATAAKGIAEVITKPGYINVDFADVRRVMEKSNVAIMGSGTASGPGRALLAVESALSSPLLNNRDISGATNVLVNITASKESLKMQELSQIMDVIVDRAGGDPEFIKRGIVYDSTLGDTLNVTVIATGFGMKDIPEMIILRPDDDKEVNWLDPLPGTEEDTHARKALDVSETPFEVRDNKKTSPVREEKITKPAEIAFTPPPRPQPDIVQEQAAPSKPPVLVTENEADIQELEKTPAYVRKNRPANNSGTHNSGTHHSVTHNTLSLNHRPATSAQFMRSPSGAYCLSAQNPYVDKRVD